MLCHAWYRLFESDGHNLQTLRCRYIWVLLQGFVNCVTGTGMRPLERRAEVETPEVSRCVKYHNHMCYYVLKYQNVARLP